MARDYAVQTIEATSNIRSAWRVCGARALLLLTLTGAALGELRAADEIDYAAVRKAQTFLQTAKRGQYILSFLHFGANYRAHNYKEVMRVTDGSGNALPGQFALIYHFDWEANGAGWTNLACFCDARGNITGVKALDTNAVLQQPFLAADATIQVIGRGMAETFKSQMNEDDRKQMLQFINNADSKGLLEMALQIQQVAGL